MLWCHVFKAGKACQGGGDEGWGLGGVPAEISASYSWRGEAAPNTGPPQGMVCTIVTCSCEPCIHLCLSFQRQKGCQGESLGRQWGSSKCVVQAPTQCPLTQAPHLSSLLALTLVLCTQSHLGQSWSVAAGPRHGRDGAGVQRLQGLRPRGTLLTHQVPRYVIHRLQGT